jgi:hypothetical protein
MAEDSAIPKSLIEQITDELSNRLRDKKGFDPSLIEKINQLAANGELKKRPKLVALLKAERGENETA